MIFENPLLLVDSVCFFVEINEWLITKTEMITKVGRFYSLEKTWQKSGDRRARGIREGFMEGTFIH